MGGLKTEEYLAIWLQAASCSGCSVSVLNTVSPTIKDLLLDEVIPGRHINLRFHPTIMAGSGEIALEALEGIERELQGSYLLIVEGAIPTADGYCSLGEESGEPIPISSRVESLRRNAMATMPWELVLPSAESLQQALTPPVVWVLRLSSPHEG